MEEKISNDTTAKDNQSVQLNNIKTNNPTEKWAEDLNRHFSKDDISSVQFSRSVMSDSLQPHESQHARPPCPYHHLPEFTQTHVHQVRNAIQPSHPLSSPSPPALNPS